jgi:hypothetical protein
MVVACFQANLGPIAASFYEASIVHLTLYVALGSEVIHFPHRSSLNHVHRRASVRPLAPFGIFSRHITVSMSSLWTQISVAWFPLARLHPL